jgi:hypothetical protein
MGLHGWLESGLVNLDAGAKILDAQVTPATSDPTGNVCGGFLRMEGPLNKVLVRPDETMMLNGSWTYKTVGGRDGAPTVWDLRRMELFLDECLETNTTMYTMPLYKVPVFDTDWYGDDDRYVYVYLLLSVSEKEPGCYIRRGLARDTLKYTLGTPEIWRTVINGADAPCDEFLGPSVGHRIRII